MSNCQNIELGIRAVIILIINKYIVLSVIWKKSVKDNVNFHLLSIDTLKSVSVV